MLHSSTSRTKQPSVNIYIVRLRYSTIKNTRGQCHWHLSVPVFFCQIQLLSYDVVHVWATLVGRLYSSASRHSTGVTSFPLYPCLFCSAPLEYTATEILNSYAQISKHTGRLWLFTEPIAMPFSLIGRKCDQDFSCIIVFHSLWFTE